jgi:hypothetical protein
VEFRGVFSRRRPPVNGGTIRVAAWHYRRAWSYSVLRRERDRYYFVYPSWAELSYSWEDLPRYLSDPLNCPLIRDDPNRQRRDWRELGFPIPAKPFDLISGPAGGGIVRAHIRRRERWLPGIILGTEANICPAQGTITVPDESAPAVCYLEPMDTGAWQFGAGERKKLYLCSASPEHAYSASDDVYWVLGYRKAKKEPKGVSELPQLASHFGLTAAEVPSLSASLRDEVAPWFVSPDYEYKWLRVEGGEQTVDYQFAVVLYLALHLRKVAGPRLSYMHLVADIEGRLNIRGPYWSRK